jgi:PAS domain S-box-containing protein
MGDLNKNRQRQSAVSRVREAVVKMESSHDLESVLEGVRNGLREMEVAFDNCGVNLIDSGSSLSRFQGLRITETGVWKRDPLPKKAQEILLGIWQKREVAYRPDLEAEDEYGEVDHIRENYQLSVRSVVDVPFARGTLAVNSARPRAFSNKDIDVLREMAEVLSEGIVRLEDLRALETRNRELEKEVAGREKVEDELRENQRMLSTLMSNLPGMAYRCLNSRDWIMEFVSEGCVELTGYQASELIQNRGISYGDVIHPEDRQKVWQDIQGSLARGESFQLTYRILCATGKEKWVWEQGRAVPTADSEQTILEGFITDITERRKGEEQLQLTVARLRLLVELARDISANLDLEALVERTINELGKLVPAADLRIIYLYDEQEEVLVPRAWSGYDDRAIEGIRLHIGESISGKVFANGRAHLTRSRREAEEYRGRLQGDNNRFFSRALRQRTIRSNICAPLRTHAGQTIGTITMGSTHGVFSEEDLSLLEGVAGQIAQAIAGAQLVAALRESEERWRSLVENAPVVIATLDRQGTIRFINRFQLYPPEEVIGRKVRDIFSADEGNRLDEILEEVFTLGEGVAYESTACPNGGERVWYDNRVVPLRSVDGEVGLAMFISTDITERRQAEEALREFSRNAIRLQEEERRSVARELHDGVNQILTAARFSLYTTESMVGRPKEAEQLMDEAIQEIRRISRHLRPGVLDDLGLLPAVRSLGKGFAEHSGVKVMVEEDDFPVEISEEAESTIYRVVQEALNNVGKHAGADRVRLRFFCEEGAPMVRIEDDGKGFEIETVRERKEGMGLNNMEERASLMGGTLHIDSSSGEGTVVSLRLPVEGRGRYGDE